MAKLSKSATADRRALLKSSIPDDLVNNGKMRFDSAEDASVFFARELDHIKAKTYDKIYPKFTALNNIPQSSEADPGDETITYYSYDKTGFATIISNYATDLPRADVKGTPTTVPIKSLGDSYGYNVQEMRASRKAGKGLDARRAESARYQIEYLANKIAIAGDEETKMMGILSPWNDIPLYMNPAQWVNSSADEILSHITKWYQHIDRTTNNVEEPDSLMLPSPIYREISSRRIPDTDTTVLSFLLENFKQLKKIVPTPEFTAENAEFNPYGEDVAFLYTDDPDKLTFEVPMPFLQHTLQPKGLEFEVPCEERVAGLMLYYPLSALIILGI